MATVYSLEGQTRNAEAIMGLKEADDTHKPRARNKRVWASVEREPQAVTNEVFQEGYAVIRPRNVPGLCWWTEGCSS
jgi:hypothetical protein